MDFCSAVNSRSSASLLMTCTGCEAHIENEVNKLDGILKVDADYETANTIVKYDETKVDLQKIETAILSTGYKIVE